jgi:hypothetical protein
MVKEKQKQNKKSNKKKRKKEKKNTTYLSQRESFVVGSERHLSCFGV